MTVVGTIPCPVCHKRIPLAQMIDGQLEVTSQPTHDHVAMHKMCVCHYVRISGDRIPDPTCPANHP